MIDLLVDPKIWISLFSITLIQIALGADNLIIITIIANKLPASQRTKAVNLGLVLAMVFRILLLSIVSYILKYVTGVFYQLDTYYLPDMERCQRTQVEVQRDGAGSGESRPL
jgi:predicted tellurium resistance membrane protein TerC